MGKVPQRGMGLPHLADKMALLAGTLAVLVDMVTEVASKLARLGDKMGHSEDMQEDKREGMPA